MKTSSIMPTVVKIAGKPFQVLANNRYMQKFCDKFEVSQDKMIEYTTIASLLGKDTIGCYMYVRQSLNNEKIPEEKRSFVAALDLTNGGLMILSQLITYITLSRPAVQNKLFGKFFDKVFDTKTVKNLITTIRNETRINGNSGKVTKVEKAIVNAEIEKVKKTVKDVFGFITSLIASTTIAKRIIVPFLATPMADWAQEKFIDKGKKKTPVKGENSSDTNKDGVDKATEKIKVSATTAAEVKEPEFKGNLLEKYKNK